MNLDEAIEHVQQSIGMSLPERVATLRAILNTMEQAKAMIASTESVADKWRTRAMHIETVYHRYFKANMQTQKGLNRMVKKCQRQKAKIEQLQSELAAAIRNRKEQHASKEAGGT